MSKHIRLTALLLVVCLLLNTVALPVAAEEPVESTLSQNETTNSTEETTAPTEETTAPTEETTAPTEETTAPTEETTAPTEETTNPKSPLDIEPVRAEMSLAWWALNRGKMDTAACLAAFEDGALSAEEFVAELTFVPEDGVLEISCAADLILLSYVDPHAYSDLVLSFCPSSEENHGFNLMDALDGCAFSPLGSEDNPFRGEIRFDEETGPIALAQSLFCYLSDDSVISGLSLECRADDLVDGGLLATDVVHENGGETWSIRLEAPVLDEDEKAYLPPLVKTLGAECDITLEITDNSGLDVIGNGFLCGEMGTDATLSVSGLSAIPAVTSDDENVGGLVGIMHPGASLDVQSDSLRVSSVTGSINAGGLIGAATDPILVLPSVTGENAAVICAENVGGLIGSLTCSAGEYSFVQSVQNLTLNGSENAGGLFGTLSNQGSTISVTADTESVLFGDNCLGDIGSLTGAYYARTLDDALLVNGEPISETLGYGDKENAGNSDTSTEEPRYNKAEVQAMLDEIKAEEVKPGEMSLRWWAVVTGQVTAESIMAELKGEEDDSASEENTDSTEGTAPEANSNFAEEEDSLEESIPYVGNCFVDEGTPSVAGYSLTGGEGEPAAQADNFPTELLPDITGNTIKINTSQQLILLSWVDATKYCKKTLELNLLKGEASFNIVNPVEITTDAGVKSTFDFLGLGGVEESTSFSGTFTFIEGTENTPILLARPLFNFLSDSATLDSLNLKCQATTAQNGLLAEKVTHDNNTTTAGAWTVNLLPPENIEDNMSISLPPIIGTMGSGSRLSLTVNDISGLAVKGRGYLCGTMEANSSLTVNGVSKLPAVSNTDGNAGGLVGEMESKASLTVNGDGLTLANVTASTSDGKAAGGLVGYAVDPVLELPAIAGSNATITGGSAGGLIGCLDITATKPFTLPDIQNLTVAGTTCSGGLYGELYNKPADANTSPATYEITANNGISPNVTLTGGKSGDRNVGGLIGKYYSNHQKNTLTVQGITVSSTASSATSYGGVIGKVDGAAYVEFSNITTNTNGNLSNYGGLIGNLSDSGHVVKIGAGVKISGDFRGTNVGGLIGSMPSGVLYIANDANAAEGVNVFPKLSLNKITENVSATRGWILGNRGNTLVYTDTDIPDRSAKTDRETNDTGVWGQVLRVDQINTAEKTLITLNPDHTVTVKAPASAYSQSNGANVTIGDKFDFAAVALRLQLDAKGALTFDGVDFDKNSEVIITLSESLTAAIDLNNTGLTGLTRDVDSPDVFKLSIDGNGKTITLPDLTVYASGSAHNRQGLIAKAGKLTVNGLTINGNLKTHVLNGNIYSGALLAEAAGQTVLRNVTASVQMTIDGTSDKNDCAYSGLVATTHSACTSITFDGCTLDSSSSVTDNTPKNSYVAGFLALGNYDNGAVQTQVIVENCSVGGKIKKEGTPGSFARIGGLITTLYNGSYTLDISGLTVSDLTVSCPDNFDKVCGGLLGHEWMKTTATIFGVTISNCTLNAGKAMFGGLVYKGSGYWRVGTDDGRTGISITNSSFSGKSDHSNPSGLLVCRANVEDEGKGALYLEILHNGYSIGEKVSVTLTDNGEYFDELVGTTKGVKGNGIVSIATAIASTTDSPAKIDQKDPETEQYTCNTYKNKIHQWINPDTRYYYNLNLFRSNLGTDPDTGIITGNVSTIDNAEKMVLWSAWDYCDSTLNDYFIKGTPATISGNLDLSGYSYYPVFLTGGVTIENGTTITFDYEGLETAEGASTTGEVTIPENKKPSNSQRQHNGMHTGLFTNVGSASANASLTINGLTLRGTVGGSAIINGTARGKESTAMTELVISNVKLDGIRTVTPDGSLLPLLINGIESFTSLELTDVTTTEAYGDLGTAYAATSLIGNVGETSGGNQVGQYIQLDFSQIALDGRIEADGSNLVHNTTRSIFREALFLKEFQYADTNSWGIYNFTQTDSEHGAKYYTLGEELSNGATEENVRNGSEQFYFYGTEDYVYCDVNGITEGNSSDATTFFKGGKYRRYVLNKEASSTTTHHEMDINLFSMDIIKGCGTYSDPYIIESGKQLSAVADVLNGRQPKKNWSITLNPTVFASVQNDGSFPQDGHQAEESTADKQYKWNGSQWLYIEPGTENASEADKAAVLTYLRNAYYLLKKTESKDNVKGNDGVIKFSSGWGGLGSKTYPFRGVIVSGGDVTVQINAPNATQFGGLIAFSEGSVVKNVKIQYDQAPTITCTSAPSSMDAPFFGGVVGWCIGGDTIIDNVTVAYANNVSPTITGSMAHLVPVGGYVGLVGGTEGLGTTSDGLGGGVVFRNITSSSLSSVSVGGSPVDPSEDSNYFYVNPFVGRVLDGYAITEGTGFINTDKNYKIPSIAASGLSIGENSQINVSDGAGLWLLSAIANSGALGTVRAYTSGKARFCNYNTVGGDFPTEGVPDEASGASPYLIRKYELDWLKNKINKGAVSIELTGECNMSSYGNGFRGIGTSYSENNSVIRLIKVKQLDGRSQTVTLDQNRKEYLDEGSNWTSIGTGLFVRLYQDSSSNPTIIKNLTLKGSTGITYYNGTDSNSNSTLYDDIKDLNLNTIRLNQVGAGMLASSVAKMGTTDLTIENVTLDNVKVNNNSEGVGSVFAGGMIGVIWGGGGSKDNYLTITLKDCAYTNPTVRGFVDAGGFIGRVRAKDNGKCAKIVITYSTNALLTGGNIATTSIAYDRGNNFSTVGGLIGCTYFYDLDIRPSESTNAMLTISKLNVESRYTGNTGDRVFGGGLVGLCYTPKTKCTIQNVEFTGTNTISGAQSGNRRQLIGGLIGTLTNGFGWNNGGNASVTVSNIHIAESGSLKIQYTQQAGALFGILNIGGQIQLSDITIGSNGDSPSVMIANIKKDGSYANIGGLVGGGNALKNVSLNDIQINNTYVLLDNNNGKTRGAALLFGFIENGGDTASIKVRNLTLKNSYVVTGSQETRAGFVYGFLNNQNSSSPAITGSNILIEKCQLGYNTFLAGDINANNFTPPELTTNGTAAGMIGGDCTNSHTTVKLVGVRVKDCTTPAQNFGTTKPKADSYVIRVDYAGEAKKASEVTTKPSRKIPGVPLTTGDGIAFVKNNDGTDSNTPLAQKIVEDYWDTRKPGCQKYFNATDAMEYFSSNQAVDSSYFSTFNKAGENSEKLQTDFPVLVINTNQSSKITEIVKHCISLLTNDTVAPRTITAKTYQLDATGTFKELENKCTLNVNGTTLSVNSGRYDNRNNQFTLLDVTYDDPTCSGSEYHLYIPAIVIKVLEYRFWAAAKMGTSYSTTAYDGLNSVAIGSHGETVTALITFEYCREKAEWQAAVDNGENLLWNFEKKINLGYLSKDKLPAGTRLTLVDLNNQDRAYFAKVEDGSADSYLNYDVSFEGWDAVPLCDLLNLSASEATNGTYVALENETGATLKAKLDSEVKYFRPATSLDPEGSRYTITVGNSVTNPLQEQYYLTIQTPETTTKVVNFVIKCDDTLTSGENTKIPTKRIPNENGGAFNRTGRDENHVALGKFFRQTVEVITDQDRLISAETNNKISATLKTTITFTDKDNKKLFGDYLTDQLLYQSFTVYLKEGQNPNVTANRSFADNTLLTVSSYKTNNNASSGTPWSVTLDGSTSSYRIVCPSAIESSQLTNSDNAFVLTAEIELAYSGAGIIEQFPVGSQESTNVGIFVCAESRLAYGKEPIPDENALNHASLRATGEGGQRFFRNETGTVSLNYNADTQSSGTNQLGINGLEGNTGTIHSSAVYNVSNLSTASTADTLQCTFSLWYKDENGKYTQNITGALSNYLTVKEISALINGGTPCTNPSESGMTFSFPLADFDKNIPIQIPIELTVYTGDIFEGKGSVYSNCKVVLTAKLLKNGVVINDSIAEDYIVYTNAKIRFDMIS